MWALFDAPDCEEQAMKKQKAKKEITAQQRRMGIAARNKQNKELTNRILAKRRENGSSN